MNSWNKHVPKMVFGVGIFFLLYAMVTFFRGPADRPVLPGKAHTPPQVEMTGPVQIPAKYVEKSWIQSGESAGKKAQVKTYGQMPSSKPENFISSGHLRKVGLEIQLPQDMFFGEAKTDGLNVLVGTGKSGKNGFYLFTGKGKVTGDQARAMLEDQFREEGLRSRSSNVMNNKNGLGQMTVFKGTTNGNEEFQAYYFTNSKTGNSHMVIMMDRELSRQPARIRQVIDSISSAR